MSNLPPKAAIIGWPAKQSLSPRLHGFWLRRYGIVGAYEALPTPPEELGAVLRGLRANGFCGVNLTIPHKEAACNMMNVMDDAARRIGAVNLVLADERGKLHGRNTDAFGFQQNLLMSGFTHQGRAALVLGAGGAARAVIVALQDLGFQDIRIANRTAARAENLAKEFSLSVVEWEKAMNELADVELLVNTTSLGMDGQQPLAFALNGLGSTATVADIVYAPLETDLLRRAKQHGLRTIDGLGMLLHQARPSFAAFFGHDPEVTAGLRDYVLEPHNG